MDKLVLKFIWNCKGVPNSQNNLEKEGQRWRIQLALSDFKSYYKATVIKQHGTDVRIDITISESPEKTHTSVANRSPISRPPLFNGGK